MPEGGSWFGRFWRGRARGRAPRPGEPRLMTGLEAVLAVERLACDVLVGALEGPPGRAANAWDRPVSESVRPEPAAAVTQAVGGALTGLRACVVLPADGLAAASAPLADAARWRVPLVTIAPTTGRDGIEAAAGAFVLVARNAQEAVDLLQVAHRAAEESLTPGIVLLDEREIARAVQDVLLPDPPAVRDWLGDPSGEIDSPTPAQALLFGRRRARVPALFDPDRVVARIGAPGGPEAIAAAAARDAFFGEPLAGVVRASLGGLAERTGRELDEVRRYGPEEALLVAIACGAAAETTESVAIHLEDVMRGRLAVVAPRVLRPLPGPSIRAALAGAAAVSVFERAHASTADPPPIARAVAPLLSAGTRLASARLGTEGAPLEASGIGAALLELAGSGGPRPVAWPGLAPPRRSSGHARRDVLAQRVARDCPRATELSLTAKAPLDTRPDDARTVTLVAADGELSESALRAVAATLAASCGPHVRARTVDRGDGTRAIHATASRSPLLDPGDAPPAELMLVTSAALARRPRLLEAASPGARIFIAHADAHGDETRGVEPAVWAALRDRAATAWRVPGGREALVDGLAGWLAGGTDGAEEIVPPTARGAAPDDEPELPLVLRRRAQDHSAYDDVARFWGEHAQPLRAGDAAPFADPYLALGVTPSATATFHDASDTRDAFPRIDATLCTGCGACWSCCPDSALAPVALSTHALLDAAIERVAADATAPGVATLRRAARRIAGRVDARLAKTTARDVSPGMLGEEVEAEVAALAPGEEEAAAALDVGARAAAALGRLPFASTPALFHEPHAARKGTGVLLGLAVSPQACQGCGVCAAVCPEDAIAMHDESADSLGERRSAWQMWEALPDTPGAAIRAAQESGAVGTLAAPMLSRHALLSVVGGDGAEPGSGVRIAVRQVAALVEHERQRVALARIERIDGLLDRLRGAIRAAVTPDIPTDDLGRLDDALDDAPAERVPLSDVLTRLDEDAGPPGVDVGGVRRLVGTARALEDLRGRLAEGPHGVGRARYALVVAGDRCARWAASFGRNPFTVPVAAGSPEHGASLALGLAEGLAARGAAEARVERRARLLLEPGPDLEADLDGLARLDAAELDDGERASLTPVVLLLDEGAYAGAGAGALDRLLGSDLPVMLLVLDGRDLAARAPDAALAALARRDAYVAACSIAHPDHLARAVREALAARGPALLHLHVPSPGNHGFDAAETIERARSAVASRVHPLLRYDPRAEGVFGTRLDLDGNPDIGETLATDAEGVPATPAGWAAGEARFAPYLEAGDESPVLARGAAARVDAWRTLQELAGVVTPFTDRVRAAVERELDDARRTELAALEARQDERHVARLRERLLALAGVELKRARNADGDPGGARDS